MSPEVKKALASLHEHGRASGLSQDHMAELAAVLRERGAHRFLRVGEAVTEFPFGFFCWAKTDDLENLRRLVSPPQAPEHIQALIRGLRTPGSPWVFGAAMAAFDENIDLRKGIRPELYWFMATHTWTVYTLPKGVVDTLISELEKVQ